MAVFFERIVHCIKITNHILYCDALMNYNHNTKKECIRADGIDLFVNIH